MNREWTEEALAAELAATRFALIELTLFLDTHPEDKEALAMFCEYRNRYEELARKYTGTFGPLTIGDVSGRNGWTWGSTPMPHEGGK
ncbi:MAG: spore coat protein CotJB [Clostridia bacterium]|nr:spore coat protein CotJB [Clostridia bacterium]